MGLKNCTSLSDEFELELYDYDINGSVTKVKYKGPWLIVDNGYHNWSTTVPPFKDTTSVKEIRFSNWLESIRKDVECTFGILKGRILKLGIRLDGISSADKIWKTCCALYNLLLDVDGLDEQWENGVPSDWEGDLGNHDDIDVLHQFPLQRLNNPELGRGYDISGMGRGSDRVEDNYNDDAEYDDALEDIIDDFDDFEDTVQGEFETNDNDSIPIRKMSSLQAFRTKLVIQFDIAYNKGEIQWPKRNKSSEIRL